MRPEERIITRTLMHSTVDDRYIVYQSPIQVCLSKSAVCVVLPVWIDGHPPVRDVGLVGR